MATVHACPPDGSGLTPCCARTPFELPHSDRMTSEQGDVTCTAPSPEPWTLDHQLTAFAKTESRAGAPTAEGERWMERRQTGQVMVVCNCGYSSGLIDHTELQALVAGLIGEHPA